MSADDLPTPREPSAYRPGIHFGERFGDRYSDRKRHLDGEIINGCIENGVVTKQGRDLWWLRETFGGVTYRLVIDTEEREVVTGYPVSINTDAARESGRWSAQQIEEIRHFIATDPR
ncbi:hypothetical protein [Halopelagius fulvigenes]|uniref:Uncharacterized protein n=1 Tax=Halopelagius fulvigenes TaxID=1198324 RepID=A0ABD5TYT9_9EURY